MIKLDEALEGRMHTTSRDADELKKECGNNVTSNSPIMHVVIYEKNVESIDVQKLEIVASNRTSMLGNMMHKENQGWDNFIFYFVHKKSTFTTRTLYMGED